MATIVRGKNPNKPYTVRYYHDGRQRERSFATAKDAKNWLVKFEHDSREKTFVDPKVAGEKFGAVALRWLARHPGSPKTKTIYESALRVHVLPVFGSNALIAVAQDREGVERFVRETLPAKGLGVSTIRTCAKVIGAIVNDAIKAGRISQSRLSGVVLPVQAARAELVFATHDQVVALAERLPEPFGFSVFLMRGCGLRVSEALGFQPHDFINGSLRLARQLAPDGKSTIGLKHRASGEYRDIPVPDYVRDVMPRGFDGFPQFHQRTYRTWFAEARDAVGLPASFTPHALRHTFASVALAGGVPITDVSKWLGHRDINVTFSIYGHLVPASWERARGVLDAEWTG